MLLQHARMGQHDRVIKKLGVHRAGFDAGLALDTDSGDSPVIFRTDRSHGTYPGTDPAVVAAVGGLWLCLEEIGGRAVLLQGPVISGNRLDPLYGSRCGNLCHSVQRTFFKTLDFLRHISREPAD